MPRRKRTKRPSYDPADRIRLKEFLKIARIGRTTFFTKFRNRRYWNERFDIRVDPLNGYLHMSRSAAEAYGREIKGSTGRSPLADRLQDHSRPGDGAPLLGSAAEGADAESYGFRVAALAQALADDVITRDQFDRALADLEP